MSTSKMKSYLVSYIINKLQHIYFNYIRVYHLIILYHKINGYMHHLGWKVIHLPLIKAIMLLFIEGALFCFVLFLFFLFPFYEEQNAG